MKIQAIALLLILLGTGCISDSSQNNEVKTTETNTRSVEETVIEKRLIQFPIEDYANRRTKKAFGEYIQDRFVGYHIGDDIEYVYDAGDVPVHAIANGTVRYVKDTPGYGGLVIIQHEIDDRSIMALYGHVSISSIELTVGNTVKEGQNIAILGQGASKETDGERKHLHFGLYEGEEIRLQGYESTTSGIQNWINPQDFFIEQGLDMQTSQRNFVGGVDLGEEFSDLTFQIPPGLEVEYVPSLKSLNLFTLSGEGSARERSQIFIRYFDASQFLTLSTVTIHSVEDNFIGAKDYTARIYDIEKKSGVPNFSEQPLWRNTRHIVTDFVKGEGFNRYYVVASNPDLDPDTYHHLLQTIEINQ